jgi:hypothetical protein
VYGPNELVAQELRVGTPADDDAQRRRGGAGGLHLKTFCARSKFQFPHVIDCSPVQRYSLYRVIIKGTLINPLL